MCGSGTRRRRLRLKVQLSRDCAGRFGWNLHGITARSAFCDTVKVASAGTSVRACYDPRRNARRGVISTTPRKIIRELKRKNNNKKTLPNTQVFTCCIRYLTLANMSLQNVQCVNVISVDSGRMHVRASTPSPPQRDASPRPTIFHFVSPRAEEGLLADRLLPPLLPRE